MTTLFAATSMAPPANAQGAAEPQTAQTQVEEIVVTGSRIIRDGYEAPTPLTVVGAEQIEAAARENLADYVNTLPAVIGSFTPSSSGGNVSGAQNGTNNINLRGLGTTRTLVLLDGQRAVASAVDGTPDVSEFPQGLVSRVDVVTGGASATYGSDAVAGVVNFILDKEFVGLKGSAEGGVTTYGDDRSWKISVTGGTGFNDGRGHFLISGEASSRDGVVDGIKRPWNLQGWFTLPNPGYTATNGQPQYLFGSGGGLGSATTGGLITNTALKGVAFGPGGAPYQFNYGSIVGGNYMFGGDWQSSTKIKFGTLDSPITRQNIFTRTSYDIADTIQAYIQLSWAHSQSLNESGFAVSPITIQATNPFLPPSVAAAAAALKITQFNLGRQWDDVVNPANGLHDIAGSFGRYVTRIVVGASGKFDAFDSAWNWDAYYQKGHTHTSESSLNNINIVQQRLALNAVRNPANGQIVCASTLTNPNDGCIPFNPFGMGVNSQAAINYILLGGSHRNQAISEDDGSITVRGEPFSNWAGPVSLASNFEWRKEQIRGVGDPLSALAQWTGANFLATNGQYTVAEGSVEAVIPLAKETAWAKALDLNAAVRETGYSTSGNVTTWKAGVSYTPVDDIRIRASRSRDIRAPNLGDLFLGGTNSRGGSVTDPFNNNVTTPTNSITSGNSNLIAESADTTEVGVVVQPAFFPGFSGSVDYWNIHLSNGVGSIAAQQIINNCYQGQTVYCGAFSKGPTEITVQVKPFNIATQIRRGLDFEASYTLHMNEINNDWDGALSFRLLTTRYLKAYTATGVSPATDTVGQSTGSGPPKWVYNATIVYTNDPVSLTLSGHGFSAGTFDNTFVACASGCPASTVNNPTINYNHVPGIFYLDTTVNYKIGGETLFLSVQNLANKNPPPAFTLSPSYYGPSGNPGLFDVVGRMFRAGVRFKL